MATIQRNIPPSVAQTLQDSCWAAVLESWSRIDPRFNPHLSQRSLIHSSGEGDTGGITPVSKIPMIAWSHNLAWELSEGPRLLECLARYLATSQI